MEINCYHCNTKTTVNIQWDATLVACPSCGTIYNKNNSNDYVFKDRLKKINYYNSLEIGQTATLNKQEYTIIGYLIKGYGIDISWIEYILQNKEGAVLYLSESSGNFVLLEQIEYEKKVGNHPLYIDYQEKTFDRYDYCYPTLKFAAGCFDFNIFDKIELIEYINPPYLLSFEKFGKEQTAYYGKHISRKEIKKAFNTTQIPPKTEIGMAQPFPINIRNLVMVFCVVAILTLLSHLYFTKDRVTQEVLNTEIPFDKYSNKEFVSPTFELKGSAAPLQISLISDVNNSWANAQIALINEKNNEEIYASKDIEYYHGYTDGENWTEGSTNEDFNICGVAAGKYHLSITPSKATEDVSNSSMYINVTWYKPSFRNFYMIIIFMVVFVLVLYYISKYFEDKRWGNQ
jgi:hypothetical protein